MTLGNLSTKKGKSGFCLSGGFPSLHNSSGAFRLLCFEELFPFFDEDEDFPDEFSDERPGDMPHNWEVFEWLSSRSIAGLKGNI